MIQVCAWCKEQIRDLGGDSQEVSDGICADCRKKHFPETRRSVREQAAALVAKDSAERDRPRG
jgi:hypothetical protein